MYQKPHFCIRKRPPFIYFFPFPNICVHIYIYKYRFSLFPNTDSYIYHSHPLNITTKRKFSQIIHSLSFCPARWGFLLQMPLFLLWILICCFSANLLLGSSSSSSSSGVLFALSGGFGFSSWVALFPLLSCLPLLITVVRFIYLILL